jgi:hypothetical protein
LFLFSKRINKQDKNQQVIKLQIKKVCRDLDFEQNYEDLNILIAFANHLKPGITDDVVFQ